MTTHHYDLNEPRGLWQCAQCRNFVLHLFAGADGRGVCGVCLDEEAAALLDDIDATTRPVDEMVGCVPEPERGTWCAASWITFLEHYEGGMLPAGSPTLCHAHMAKLQFDIERIHRRSGILDSMALASDVNAQADAIISAARRQAIRVGFRIEDR
jgi:hypothetical protein